jgi:hypothetical protein
VVEKEDGETVKFFAPEPLHNKLSNYGANTKLEITKYKKDGKTLFFVKEVGKSSVSQTSTNAGSGGQSTDFAIEEIWLYEFTLLQRGVKRLGLEYDIAALQAAATGCVIQRDRARGLQSIDGLITTAQIKALHTVCKKSDLDPILERIGANSSKQLTRSEAGAIISKFSNDATEVVNEPPKEEPVSQPRDEGDVSSTDEENDLPF